MLGAVGTPIAVFACPDEKEEGNPGDIADGDNSSGGSLGGSVQDLDNADREGPHSCWSRIILLIGRHLASQPNVELPHAVLSGVVGSQGCEDLIN